MRIGVDTGGTFRGLGNPGNFRPPRRRERGRQRPAGREKSALAHGTPRGGSPRRCETVGGGRFPLLCKILDARAKLSLQVHPSASTAAELNGEAKTEMWFIAQAGRAAELFVGLKRGVTRAGFEKKIADGSVADAVQRISVHAGDAMFVPGGQGARHRRRTRDF